MSAPRRGGRAARLAAAARPGPGSPPDAPALSDEALTGRGLEVAPAVDRAGRVLAIACGALAREILALTAQPGLGHVDLHCLPAILHNHPERIAPAVERAVAERAAGYGAVVVAYADCGTGGALEALCARIGARMLPGAHCYAFFEGVDAFAARGEIDAFYLTDFLARQFDAFVTKPLGLDRHPELRGTYFGHYRRLVYLAQTDDAALDAKARAAADALGLRYERRPTGLAPFDVALREALPVDPGADDA
ncbi:DUF1638 domain-containing protein [Jannaschia sp. W003]|uniref:DUF1638 domain-containing protein n=1 Tax=Jannaschia sp. W003 TaxID=2867012 RepID=UPI0021A402E2|nr:DUF1638 domain-containing protein [Jannaschia sp. W003]UWQ20685.1 DUF1638 domain-containing protein [Jannaschia sp. W003]